MNRLDLSPSRTGRDPGIDVLRMLAIVGIVIVHTNPPVFWQQLRSFDVPLMVILSGICFGIPTIDNNTQYYRKRFIRMIIPSWIFLSFYFLFSFLLGNNVDIKRIIMCYTFMTPWYFWIVRILFVTALAAPFLATISRRLSINNIVILVIVMLFVSEMLAQVSDNYIYVVIVMFIPYIAFYLVGMNLTKFSETQILNVGVLMLFCYIAMAGYLFTITNEYIPTGLKKYPPPILL